MYLRVGGKGKKMLFKQLENEEKRGRKFVVDEHIKVCKSCNHTWEKLNYKIHNVKYTVYPFGLIPRIGKEVKTCPRCKDQESR